MERANNSTEHTLTPPPERSAASLRTGWIEHSIIRRQAFPNTIASGRIATRLRTTSFRRQEEAPISRSTRTVGIGLPQMGTKGDIVKLQLFCIYIFGILVCWASLAAFWQTHGERASLLAFILFALENLVRSSINHAVGRHLLLYPPPLFSPSVLLASAIVACLFPATYTHQAGRLRYPVRTYAMRRCLARAGSQSQTEAKGRITEEPWAGYKINSKRIS